MAPIDPRDLEPEHIGTRLRDAAVDPEPTDFLAPLNAGETGELGNPHGPTVVSPEIHGSEGVRPIRPGPVSSDPDEQNDDEVEHTAQWQPQTDPVEAVTITGATTVEAGETIALVATATRGITGAHVVTASAEWETSDATKATVSASGVVTGVAAGSVTITATYGGEDDTHAVTVTAAG